MKRIWVPANKANIVKPLPVIHAKTRSKLVCLMESLILPLIILTVCGGVATLFHIIRQIMATN